MVQDWFEDETKEFEVLPWPPKGADINPIENVWAKMERSMDTQHIPNAGVSGGGDTEATTPIHKSNWEIYYNNETLDFFGN